MTPILVYGCKTRNAAPSAYPRTMNAAQVAEARSVADRLALEWGLCLGEALPGASCSLVLEVSGNRVLKVPFSHAEEAGAWETVASFSGHGGVGLVRCDPPSGAMLMPRLFPGTTLDTADLDDLEQVDACAQLILQLRSAPVVAGIPLARWFRELDEMSDSSIVRDARRIYSELCSHEPTSVLLHGDLHHYNILLHRDAWAVIDPKGLVGDPCFEVVGFMRNNLPPDPTPGFMRARLERFAERLGDPIERLWGWSFAQTVLCSHCPGSWSNTCERAAEAIWDARL